MSACRDPCVYLFIALCLLYTKSTREHTDYWKQKKKKSNTCYGKQSRLLCIHCLCLWEWDLLSETLETQEQNHSVNRAFGGALYSI